MHIEMTKEWFKHDAHASEDARILHLRARLGLHGYGLLWIVIEWMYRNEGLLANDQLSSCAYAARIPLDEFKEFIQVAMDSGLIEMHNGMGYTNQRVARALAERHEKTTKARSSVQTRYDRSTNVARSKSERSTNVLKNKNKSKNKEYKNTLMRDADFDAHFDAFWNAYDHKVDRHRCVKLWEKITPDERAAIMQHVPLYVQSTPDVQFRRHPSTYLKQRSWENAIPTEATHATRTVNPAGTSSRHISEEQLIRDDIERRQRLGLDTGQVHITGGPQQANGQTPLVLGPAQ